MHSHTREDLTKLVQTDRVHRDIYSDPDLFELEMKQIFGRAWLILGHESQIPKSGDFFRTEMARQPVIVSRHIDGVVHVLLNRCQHRGSLVCHKQSGNTRQFACPYHGWAYATDGELRSIPIVQGYGPDAKEKMKTLGLSHVPRVDSYRGFIFASLSPDGPSLLDFLGYMKTSFDDFVDRAPDGEIEVVGGVFKHAYNGNWKLVLENHNDTVHPAHVHVSSSDAAFQIGEPASGQEGYADIAIRQMRQNAAPVAVWEKLELKVMPYGHSIMGDYHSDSRLVSGLGNPVFKEYYEALEKRVGKERTAEILSVSRFNSLVYPNCSFMSQFRQLRIVHPVSVDRTVVYSYSFRLKGAPEKMVHDTIAFANVANGTASWVLTDDLEVYERVQNGMGAQLSDWVYLGRGHGGDVPDADGTHHGATGTSEIPIRNQCAAWLQYMTAEQA